MEDKLESYLRLVKKQLGFDKWPQDSKQMAIECCKAGIRTEMAREIIGYHYGRSVVSLNFR